MDYLVKKVKLQRGNRPGKNKKGEQVDYSFFFLSVPIELIRQRRYKPGQVFVPCLIEDGIAYKEIEKL